MIAEKPSRLLMEWSKLTSAVIRQIVIPHHLIGHRRYRIISVAFLP